MTIHLPNELGSSIRAEVLSGRFANEADAVAEIVRDYFRRKAIGAASTPGDPAANGGLGSIGTMGDDSALLEEIVADAYRERREDQWREFDFE